MTEHDRPTLESARALSAAPARGGLIAGWCRTAIFRQLSALSRGCITIEEAGDRHVFGDPNADQQALVKVRDPGLWAAAASGSVGLGEAYMGGLVEVDDITQLIRICASNEELATTYDFRWAGLLEPARRLLYWLDRNTRTGSRRNIARHYDLGNALFQHFLDPTMMYSCGIFATPESSMHEASIAKLDLICRKADLRPGVHVLEIGTGWGGFAIHAAKHYGCRVTTTTISQEQYQYAREQIRAAGLEDRIEVLLSDYRDLEGQYDRVVSIEMVEAVGHQYLGKFFEVCAARLKSDGVMVLQSITIRDREYDRARRTVDFIKRYIFPGSFLPSIEELSRRARQASDLTIFHIEDIGLHYARTLQLWRERFEENAQAIRALGYDERFMRMWRFYLCYCEAGFLERRISDVHVILHKPAARFAWPTLPQAQAAMTFSPSA
ncbi:MAG: cyclopropane-fatty-acyl-phospholipid synthase family protein [Pseudomonadota bacterium]